MTSSIGSILNSDKDIQQMIEIETQKQRFNVLVHSLTDMCWDLCIDKPTSRTDTKTEHCLVNCVDRFLDCTNFVLNRFSKTTFATSADEVPFE